MIIPHASDVIKCGVFSQGLSGLKHRAVVIMQDHPGREPSYLLVQEVSSESSIYGDRMLLDQDITSEMHHRFRNGVSIARTHVFVGFQRDERFDDFVQRAKSDPEIHTFFTELFGGTPEQLECAIRWKP